MPEPGAPCNQGERKFPQVGCDQSASWAYVLGSASTNVLELVCKSWFLASIAKPMFSVETGPGGSVWPQKLASAANQGPCYPPSLVPPLPLYPAPPPHSHSPPLALSSEEPAYICCSVAQSCLTLYDPMDCSMLGFPVFHRLPELAQTQVHCIGHLFIK